MHTGRRATSFVPLPIDGFQSTPYEIQRWARHSAYDMVAHFDNTLTVMHALQVLGSETESRVVARVTGMSPEELPKSKTRIRSIYNTRTIDQALALAANDQLITSDVLPVSNSRPRIGLRIIQEVLDGREARGSHNRHTAAREAMLAGAAGEITLRKADIRVCGVTSMQLSAVMFSGYGMSDAYMAAHIFATAPARISAQLASARHKLAAKDNAEAIQMLFEKAVFVPILPVKRPHPYAAM